jgi:uncharacterized glyoxalase superfamily protein PhnB
MSTASNTFHATGLGISLTVKDLQKSVTWYRDVLGFTVEREVMRDDKLVAVGVRAGSVEFLLGQDNGAKGWERVKGEGFSLRISTEQSIDDLANGIKARGGALETEPTDMQWGARVFRITDPDGYKLSVSKRIA